MKKEECLEDMPVIIGISKDYPEMHHISGCSAIIRYLVHPKAPSHMSSKTIANRVWIEPESNKGPWEKGCWCIDPNDLLPMTNKNATIFLQRG